ncbi:MAG: tRNA 2-thiouridine(34) synthase MnmA [Alphaproteobacteria bacterium]|nr:tRNA 2-thiouridine(34) synthase MnmA [Alphaproteobacteria bacterium]
MKILVGMSGGVDSSVAALILKQAGHEVIGATMSIWDEKNHLPEVHGNGCFAPDEEDIEEAKKICNAIGIPHLVLDCRDQYRKIVLSNFKDEYKSGRTPNPCVICNSNIKFRVLPETAKAQGITFDKFATGHYARVVFNEQNNLWQIKRGVDERKDQSYFLYRLNQEQLSSIILPLGDKTKTEIRELARLADLSVSEKPDSQDFYTGKLNDILQFQPQQGNFVTRSGKVLGHHEGYWNFTIGQRRGLGISAEKPLYVIEINKDNNEVVVGFAEECIQTKLSASSWVWQTPKPTAPFNALARIRSSQTPTEVIVSPLPNEKYEVSFMTSQSAITPGQSVVLYDNDLLLGGGIID